MQSITLNHTKKQQLCLFVLHKLSTHCNLLATPTTSHFLSSWYVAQNSPKNIPNQVYSSAKQVQVIQLTDACWLRTQTFVSAFLPTSAHNFSFRRSPHWPMMVAVTRPLGYEPRVLRISWENTGKVGRYIQTEWLLQACEVI